MVIGEQDEQGQVREHHRRVDSVEVHVTQDVFRIAVGGRPTELAVLGYRPTVVPGRVQSLELRMPTWHQRLVERELLFPEGPIPKVRGQAGLEEVDRLDDVRITRNNKFL